MVTRLIRRDAFGFLHLFHSFLFEKRGALRISATSLTSLLQTQSFTPSKYPHNHNHSHSLSHTLSSLRSSQSSLRCPRGGGRPHPSTPNTNSFSFATSLALALSLSLKRLVVCGSHILWNIFSRLFTVSGLFCLLHR